MFMLGYAYQIGALPLSAEAIEQAIELNGEAVAMNKAAFRLGRRAAADPAAIEALVEAARRSATRLACKMSQIVRRDGGAPRRISSPSIRMPLMPRATSVGRARSKRPKPPRAPGECALTEAVARYLFKLMAYKDEYEVARLYTDDAFHQSGEVELRRRNLRFEFHLAPPLFARKDKVTGEPQEDGVRAVDAVGVWRAGEVPIPARHAARPIRLQRRAPDRAQADRRLRGDARRNTGQSDSGQPRNRGRRLPPSRKKSAAIGHVKARHLAAAKAEEAALCEQFRAGGAPVLKAAE